MALFGSGKSDEDKQLERVAKALESLNLQEKNGLVHAGWFTLSGFVGVDARSSQVIDGVLEYMQKQNYEIVDVKISAPDGTGDRTLLVLYR